MGKRGVSVVGALLAVMLWPAAGGATDDMEPTTTTVAVDPEAPVTRVPDTTVPPTTVPEATVPPTTVPSPPPASPVPGAPTRTLTVTPSTGLVHDQVVVVRGTGWSPDALTGIAQCREGTTTVASCGNITYVDVGPRGGFREDFPVDVLLETGEGTVDCRLETCLIGANNALTATGARFVDLAFDPIGPDPVRRTATVTPDTGLVDGQVVNVTADGIPTHPQYGGFVEMLQCREPVLSTADCGLNSAAYSPTDVAGHLDAAVEMIAVLPLASGDHDCRTGGCALLVRAEGDSLAEAALVPLGFDPLGPLLPPPLLTVDPDTDLVDGSVVEVDGTGWRPRHSIVLIQCLSDGAAAVGCDTSTFEVTRSSDAGVVDTAVPLRTRLQSLDGRRADCRVDPCWLLALDIDRQRDVVAVPLAFDPAGGLIAPTVQLGTDGPVEDGEEVELVGDGARPGGGLMFAQCLATATGPAGCDPKTYDFQALPDPGRSGGGTYVSHFTVSAELALAGGRTVNCRVIECAVLVSDDTSSFQPSDRALLDFLPAAVDPIGATPTFAG